MADPTSPYPEMTPEQLATLSQQLSTLNSGLMANNDYSSIGGLDFVSRNAAPQYAVPENYGNPKNRVYQLYAQSPSEKIRLVGLDGTVYYEGTGDTGAKEAAALIQSFGKQFGPGATWQLQKQLPGIDDSWNTVSQDTVGKQKTTALNAFANVALPVIGSVLGGPVGAMLASGANSALQNKNSAQALKDAAIAGASAFVGGKIGNIVGPTIGTAVGNAANAIVPGASQAVTSGLSNAVGQTIAHLPGDFVITAATNPLINAITQGAVNAGATGLTSAGINSALNTGLKSGLSDLGTQPAAPPTTPPTAPPTVPSIEELVVTGTKIVPPTLPFGVTPEMVAAAGLGAGALATTAGETAAQTGATTDYLASQTTANELTAEQLAALKAAGIDATAVGNTTTIAQQIANYIKANPLRAASLGFTALGGLGAAVGGADTGKAIPLPANIAASGTRASLDPIFSASLPAPNPQFVANVARPMNVPMQDWLTYGSRPEQSFFVNVPQSTSTVPPVAAAHGGHISDNLAVPRPRHEFAVQGEGDGRSDSIPAVLSDGEYVIDAETVALLGNGSSKAGAKRLDQFRVNIRKQKGHKLAQGKFSADAKEPEAYMSGGRT